VRFASQIRWIGITIGALIVVLGVMAALRGFQPVAQTSINGLAAGVSIALGAFGIAISFSVLRIISFAHGDLLTVAAYLTLLLGTSAGWNVIIAAAVAIAAVGLLTAGTEIALWTPLRRKNAGMLQKLLVGIGLAFALRGAVQIIAGSEPRRLGIDVTRSLALPGGVRIGYIQGWALIIGLVTLVAIACALKFSRAGRKLRALADNKVLAEASGINSVRWALIVWAIAGVTAGLAGVLTASTVGVTTPNLGFVLLLSMFAATILGGVNSMFGALTGGILIGLVEEWSTMFVDPAWKLAVGFVALIVTVIIRPNGILGKAVLT
jgi:branched-subunit amino acid ABC-type transport system permease component